MNENLQIAITELINKALSGADTAKDFIVSEAPEFVQQLIAWNFTWSLILWCIGIVFICLSIIIPYKTWKKNDTQYWDEEWLLLFLIPVVGFVPGIFMFAENFDWLKIWIAPKVWLVEYAATLVK